MLARVLIEGLGQRLPQSTVIGESGAVSASPDATIELNVQRLDEDATGNPRPRGAQTLEVRGHRGQFADPQLDGIRERLKMIATETRSTTTESRR